uniref:Uncharacterized protein n=1 Tax=Aegilops tauschii subsp. strangulata TaxID=200361 RepID=A0A453T8K7_AEGTS
QTSWISRRRRVAGRPPVCLGAGDGSGAPPATREEEVARIFLSVAVVPAPLRHAPRSLRKRRPIGKIQTSFHQRVQIASNTGEYVNLTEELLWNCAIIEWQIGDIYAQKQWKLVISIRRDGQRAYEEGYPGARTSIQITGILLVLQPIREKVVL